MKGKVVGEEVIGFGVMKDEEKDLEEIETRDLSHTRSLREWGPRKSPGESPGERTGTPKITDEVNRREL